jgi:hypothetical protein
MMLSHRVQRKMGRLSAKTIVIPPMLKLDKRFDNTSVRGQKMVPERHTARNSNAVNVRNPGLIDRGFRTAGIGARA